MRCREVWGASLAQQRAGLERRSRVPARPESLRSSKDRQGPKRTLGARSLRADRAWHFHCVPAKPGACKSVAISEKPSQKTSGARRGRVLGTPAVAPERAIEASGGIGGAEGERSGAKAKARPGRHRRG